MIYGERIRLRAIEKDDLPRFVTWLNDPEVRQGLMIFLPLSLAEEEQWFENMLKRPAEQHPMVIEIAVDGKWLPIGNCGFDNINWRARAGELGLFIGEKGYWNQGYGSEVMRLLLKHGFDTLNLNRIALIVYANNPRAVRVYEKVGFIKEGLLRQAHFQNGEYIDVVTMSVLRSEWRATQ
jgi:RimJ/RimL family protein N-acetyltransferase